MNNYYVAYYRVSTDKQGKSGLGLEAQKESISRFISGRNATLLKEYFEVETATRKGNDRPQLKTALETTKELKATLVIAKLDRLTRNVYFIAGLMESKVDFIALDLPEANRLTIHIMAAFAEHEAERISERTKAALAARKARGLPCGNPQNLTPAYSHLARVEAAVARQQDAKAFANKMAPTINFYLQNYYSLNKVAHEMNRLQFLTPSGLVGKWTATTVRNCLAWVD
jgi:DNA invertase Pin-like site-specific DNA recombinase